MPPLGLLHDSKHTDKFFRKAYMQVGGWEGGACQPCGGL